MYPVGTPDETPPTSYVDSISPYWHNVIIIPFQINAIASDNISRIVYTELWYRYSTDNSSWNNWTLFGTDDVTPWNWSFDALDNDGYYEFYSIANDTAGNMEDSPGTADAIAGVDTLPPTTNYSFDPATPDGENGWYVSDVEVTLNATDNTSGVDSTEYNLDGTGWIEYTTPFTVSEDGEHNVQYRSVDKAGNIESTNSASFKIDQTDPTVTINKPQPGYLYIFNRPIIPLLGDITIIIGQITVEVDTSDETSGIDKVEFYIDDELKNADDEGPYEWTWGHAFWQHALKVIAYDNAGNTASDEQTVWIFGL